MKRLSYPFVFDKYLIIVSDRLKSKFHFSPIYSRCRIGPRKSLTNYSNGSILSADAVDAAQSLSANIGIRNRHQRMADGTMNCLFFIGSSTRSGFGIQAKFCEHMHAETQRWQKCTAHTRRKKIKIK